ncbi:protein peste-like, partial [Zophobas morio]|uniref:protein peste-like n=1 Tax=Zophobas morio TaxID=2755281 RepID=UPI0030836FEC
MKTEFHLFNWTNPEDFYNLSVKPRFVETGPYRFLNTEKKVNITWNDNGTITFKNVKSWYYDNDGNNGDLRDKIVTVDPIPLAASFILRNWNYFVKKGLFFTLKPFFRKLYITRTAGELLFDGYPEPLIKLSRAVPLFNDFNFPNWDRFGWLYNRNGSADYEGLFNMGTGDGTTFGEMLSWNGQKDTPGNSCPRIYGSAGQFFPKYLKKDVIQFFSPDFVDCPLMLARLSFNARPRSLVSRHSEIFYIACPRTDIAKFSPMSTMCRIGTIYPQIECYCKGKCVPSGAANFSDTKYGIPVFISMPHFLKADPYYLSLIDGLKPDANIHQSAMTVEPV